MLGRIETSNHQGRSTTRGTSGAALLLRSSATLDPASIHPRNKHGPTLLYFPRESLVHLLLGRPSVAARRRAITRQARQVRVDMTLQAALARRDHLRQILAEAMGVMEGMAEEME
jgi:hypothetical protein